MAMLHVIDVEKDTIITMGHMNILDKKLHIRTGILNFNYA